MSKAPSQSRLEMSDISRARFFDREAFSDITISFSGRAIKCHKIILCTTSRYFDSLCGPDSHFAEKDQAIVELKDDPDPDAIQAMLAWIYEFSYDKDFEDRQDDLALHLNVYMAAKKYLLPKLEETARKNSDDLCNRVSDIDFILAVFEQHYDQRGQDQFLDNIMLRLEEKHLPDLITYGTFTDLLAKDKSLALRVSKALALAKSLRRTPMKKCKNCRHFHDSPRLCFFCGHSESEDVGALVKKEGGVSG